MPIIRNTRVVFRNQIFPLREGFLGRTGNYVFVCPICGDAWGRLETGEPIFPGDNQYIIQPSKCETHGTGTFLPRLYWGDYARKYTHDEILRSLPPGLLLHEVKIVLARILGLGYMEI